MKTFGAFLAALFACTHCLAADGAGMRPVLVAILAFEDFELELVENPKTLKKAELLAGGATDITGFAKLTFSVADVGKLFRRLRDQGATFAIPLRDSNTRPDQQFFVVLDPEKNWLQFVGPK